jgi:aminopeptidase N
MANGHKSFRLPESWPHYPPQKDFHTAHIKIELILDFEKKSIAGACTLQIEPIGRALEKARFDACELNISKVIVDGSQTKFDYDGKTLEVPLSPGDRHDVRVDYSATPQQGVYFVGPDAEHPEKEVQAWSHSEAEDARYWYPCHDHPGDRSSTELVMTVPKGFRVISNGRLLSKSESERTTTFHWKQDIPHVTYLTSFVAGKFEELTQESRGVPLHYNFPVSKREDVLRYFGETPRMIEVFEDLTGTKYPYLKYDQTTVYDFLAGGEENLDATTLGMHYYPDADSEEDFSVTYSTLFQRSIDLVAHELSHQWFGNLVTCSDWAHAWLNEGFAVYFQELYLEKTRGYDEAVWHLETRLEEYFDEDEKEYRRPIVERNYVEPGDVFDAHLYPKGAKRLHELRFILGDEDFFKGVSAYLKDFAYSVADTHDFRKVMEKVSGVQLEEFFEQSFFKPGHPEIEASYSWDDALNTARLRVKQVQRTDEGTPIFKLPCEIVFYAGGQRQVFRSTLESADQTFTFTLSAKPLIVEIDPRHWLLKRLKFEKSLDLLLSQLARSEDAWSRVDAAMALGKMKLEASVEGLAKAAQADNFWHVRACAFRALGEIGTEIALQAVLGIAPPRDRKVRRGMAEALGNFKDERARNMLLNMLAKDESPYVRSEAALALAKAWPEGAFPHLKEAMSVHTTNETLAEACVAAMGKLKEQGVNQIIADSLAYGKPTRVRIGALKAIKERGRILDDEVPLVKAIVRADKEFRVRLQAVNGLVRALGDARFIEELKACANSKVGVNHDVRRKALETYHELSDSASRAASMEKLRAEAEQLKEENRRLSKG